MNHRLCFVIKLSFFSRLRQGLSLLDVFLSMFSSIVWLDVYDVRACIIPFWSNPRRVVGFLRPWDSVFPFERWSGAPCRFSSSCPFRFLGSPLGADLESWKYHAFRPHSLTSSHRPEATSKDITHILSKLHVRPEPSYLTTDKKDKIIYKITNKVS